MALNFPTASLSSLSSPLKRCISEKGMSEFITLGKIHCCRSPNTICVPIRTSRTRRIRKLL